MADGGSQSPKNTPLALRALVSNLFFTWGFVTVLIDPLVPKFKALFSLSYAAAMLVPFAFFVSYFVFTAPAVAILNKFGNAKTMVIGLVVMAVGCFLVLPAAKIGLFLGFLIALFCVSAGITISQFASGPFVTMPGSTNVVSSALTRKQAANSLGTFIAPIFGALYFLSDGLGPTPGAGVEALHAAHIAGAARLVDVYLLVALLIVFLAVFFWTVRDVSALEFKMPKTNPFQNRLWRNPRLMLGVGCILLYVGAEVSIGAGLTNYLMQPSVAGHEAAALGAVSTRWLSRFAGHPIAINAAQVAGAMVSIYWGVAMVGRFLGPVVLGRVSPGKVLAFNALLAVSLALVSAATSGTTAAAAVLAIGLTNSVMFPTILTLAQTDLGDDAPSAHALLMMGIAGGAIVPMIYGGVADAHDLAFALLVPAACYVAIGAYGAFATLAKGPPRSSRVSTPECV